MPPYDEISPYDEIPSYDEIPPHDEIPLHNEMPQGQGYDPLDFPNEFFDMNEFDSSKVDIDFSNWTQ
jgi:hypothetical protein